MADPDPYVVTYSFAGYQSLNPDRPLPAGPLDVELANLATFAADVTGAVTSIRRADGALQNGVVTFDSLDPQLKDMLIGGSYDVLTADINPNAFATLVEAQTGVANDKLMTPLRTADAIASLRAFATQSEAEAGVSATTSMSPLRTKQALDAQRPFASQAEAEAGSNNTKVVTPLRVKQELDALRAAFTGSASLTWGSIAAGASSTQSVVVTGAAVGDRVALGLPSSGLDAGLIDRAWVSSPNTVTIRITNVTGGPITPHAGSPTTYSATCLRF